MNKRIKKIIIVVLMVVFGSVLVTTTHDPVNAADEGAWFGGDNVPTPGGDSGGGVGGGACGPSDNLYRIDCAGMSWVYYEAKSVSSDDIQFPSAVYNTFAVNNAYISGQCSEHADVKDDNGVGGGFWHFGINGLAGSGMIAGGGTGHWQTLTYGYFKQYLPSRLYIQIPNANQQVGVYSADNYKTKFQSSEDNVLRDYQEAWKADRNSKGISYTSDDIPESISPGTYAFCYWPGMAGDQYYAKSAVSARPMSNLGMSNYDATEITQNGKAEVELKIEVDEEVRLVQRRINNKVMLYSQRNPLVSPFKGFRREVI